MSGDRRKIELGPPHGWRDRRRKTERRIPELAEQAISEDEWQRYFGERRRAAAAARCIKEIKAKPAMRREKTPRLLEDRRETELGPPLGWRERRRNTERRIPELAEQEVSENDWLRYFGGQCNGASPLIANSDAVTDALPKIRD